MTYVSISAVVALAGSAASAAVIDGDNGDNVLFGTPDADTINGLGGGDFLFGLQAADELNGDEGADTLVPGAARDVANGGNGNDVLADDAGKKGKKDKPDRFFGEAGDDQIYAADGQADRVDCGDGGSDLALVDATDEVTGCELVLSATGDTAFGFTYVSGKGGRDRLDGTDANEFIAGKGDKDVINAGNGTDVVLGGKGGDTVNGGGGFDLLYDTDGGRNDVLRGDDGDDLIFAADGAPGTVDCGGGDLDRALVDASDDVVNCELLATAPPAAEG